MQFKEYLERNRICFELICEGGRHHHPPPHPSTTQRNATIPFGCSSVAEKKISLVILRGHRTESIIFRLMLSVLQDHTHTPHLYPAHCTVSARNCLRREEKRSEGRERNNGGLGYLKLKVDLGIGLYTNAQPTAYHRYWNNGQYLSTSPHSWSQRTGIH